jgi:hypothetical protein
VLVQHRHGVLVDHTVDGAVGIMAEGVGSQVERQRRVKSGRPIGPDLPAVEAASSRTRWRSTPSRRAASAAVTSRGSVVEVTDSSLASSIFSWMKPRADPARTKVTSVEWPRPIPGLGECEVRAAAELGYLAADPHAVPVTQR